MSAGAFLLVIDASVVARVRGALVGGKDARRGAVWSTWGSADEW